MLPVVFILAAYLTDRPIRKTIFYAIPFFALSAAAGLVTLTLEKTMVGAKGAEWSFPLFERILIVSHSIWFYIGKILWPHPISFHVRPVGGKYALGCLISAADCCYRRNRGSYHFPKKTRQAACLCLSVLRHRRRTGAWVCQLLYDAIHLCRGPLHISGELVDYAAGGGCRGARLLGRLPQNPKLVIGTFATIAVLLCFAVVTADEVRKFKNVQTLWEHTIAVNPKAWLAHNNLGVIYASQGQYAKALEHYKTTIELNPDYATAYNNAGVALVLMNQPAKGD